MASTSTAHSVDPPGSVDYGSQEWSAWSTAIKVVTTDPGVVVEARRIVESWIERVDLAASRFRPDSETSRLSRVTSKAGVDHEISPLLAELVETALVAARLTDGSVDPTLGTCLEELGYGRDIADVVVAGGTMPAVPAGQGTVCLSRRSTWRDIRLEGRHLQMPAGVLLDLGATAKAWTADRAATHAAATIGCGVLVSLGGDLRADGEGPPDGWPILVQDGDDQPATTVCLTGAQAMATSSTLHRTWWRAGDRFHHIVDPMTGMSADHVWRTVSVAAATCVLANTLTTAAVVRANSAVEFLASHGAAARLVADNGTVHTVGGWPA